MSLPLLPVCVCSIGMREESNKNISGFIVKSVQHCWKDFYYYHYFGPKPRHLMAFCEMRSGDKFLAVDVKAKMVVLRVLENCPMCVYT